MAKNEIKQLKDADHINYLLENLSHTELIMFLKQEMEYNTSLKNSFLSSFLNFLPNKDKTFYVKHMNSIINSAKSKDGFINYYGISKLQDSVQMLFKKADELSTQGKLMEYFYILTAAFEGIARDYLNINISCEEYGDMLNEIESRFLSLSKAVKDDFIRRTLLEYCTDLKKIKLSENVDLKIHFLKIASLLISTKEEENEFTELLENLSFSEYDQKDIQLICYNLYNRLNDKNKAIGMIDDNIQNYLLREETIKQEIQNKHYEKAILIAQKSIEIDKDERPGLVDTWIEYLLKIAVKQKDKEKIIEYGRQVFLKCDYDYEKYYTLLKKNTEPDKWNEFIEEIIQQVKDKNKEITAYIYVKEKYWSRLLEILSYDRYNLLNILPEYERYFKKDYPAELSELYKTGIIAFLESRTGEKNYRMACDSIKNIIKLSGKDKALELVHYLINTHSKKTTLVKMLQAYIKQ
ncbi:MAG TPA: hypothetical protein PLN45_06815, partial [Exilispira sp.]|nr:hypothetical protein [Exilispira sp.]